MKNLITKYLSLEPERSLNHEKIAQALNLEFSKEFKTISTKARFDYLGSFEWFNTDGDTEYSSINMTQLLRTEHNLPNNILFLADEGESLILMQCFGDHEEIYWIDRMDFERFCKGEPLECWHKHFPTFPDFFKYLLDEEEKARAEESGS